MKRSTKGTRVLVIGLDSVPPQLFFDRPDFSMPFVRRLRERGVWGELESCDPPITVPAWAVMATGRGPSRLGLYGFRHRNGRAYGGVALPTSGDVREKALWDYVGENGGRSLVVGVPPGHPPRTVDGAWVSCFLTPPGAPYAWPPALAPRIESWLGGPPRLDAEFRKEDRDHTLRQVYETTRHKFTLMERLLAEEAWDFAMFVDIGPDRLHHAFWKFFDKGHPAYEAGHRFENAVPEYYGFLDRCLESLMSRLPPDTAVLIASDHGSKRMSGCFCLNEWLVREGYLKLRSSPDRVLPLEKCDVDWDNTAAWGWGGYYGRVFINLQGREPRGRIPAGRYEGLRRELADRLSALRGPRGEHWGNRVVLSDGSWRGDPPDLMAYFDDLAHRCAGTLGHGKLYLADNDTGPDDAVHARDGIFWLDGPGVPASGRRRARITDVAPTLLTLLGCSVPPDLEGRSLV